MIDVKSLVNKIFFLSSSGFSGIVNIGGPRMSDYQIISKYKKVKKTSWEKISKNSNVFIAKDASLNTERFKTILKKFK